jgi:hypothetical protein
MCYRAPPAPRATQHAGRISHYALRAPIKGLHGGGPHAVRALLEPSARLGDSNTRGTAHQEWSAAREA